MESSAEQTVRLEPWSEGDFGLVVRSNSEAMTDHLGGPESPEKLADRHRRYVELRDQGRMFKIVLPDGEPAGSIGYWAREWRGEPVWETGWGVFPEFQGRGIAAAAARLLVAYVREHGAADEGGAPRRALHAYPSVDHPASNAICRKAGFELLGEVAFEYPKGNPLRSNDWRVLL
ncbi:GNAT family N-acetyltransferase [Streptomyces sp. TRM66268-LWL]|uniref:GNAT family N-acetyltransferase n=1 Tax=Streptomyces polyasparticus TaxID=2767826 RepID=A0ABR7SV47_9ACTN|nr:GNAT family N-acetyltransferase [Streptomyces polyasparticus]MBC9718674.1 GNAT family N-acetyltransferase [Streptomyces polyasparticus]